MSQYFPVHACSSFTVHKQRTYQIPDAGWPQVQRVYGGRESLHERPRPFIVTRKQKENHTSEPIKTRIVAGHVTGIITFNMLLFEMVL